MTKAEQARILTCRLRILPHTEGELLSLLCWYQKILSQDGYFFMAVDILADLTPCASRTNSLCLRRAKRDNVIVMTAECDRPRRRARHW